MAFGVFMPIIEGSDLEFTYNCETGSCKAVDDVDISIERGSFTAILGKNGSGKSSLVKLFNALIPLDSGSLTVAGITPDSETAIWKMRRCCGMVFQNPDNQFVSSVVEEDIAFGLENYEVPFDLIPEKIKEALRMVGMEGFEKRAPNSLSGGQKQRIALAGVLALNPDVLILDEAASMIDPRGRKELLEVVRWLNVEQGKTIIMISHYIEDVVSADCVFLMKDGKIIANGTPRDVFSDEWAMTSAGLIPPFSIRVWHELRESGISLERCPLTEEELAEDLCRLN